MALAMKIPGERKSQAEGIADAKALRWFVLDVL